MIPNAIVASAHGEIPTNLILEKCNTIDLWELNVYRWDDPAPVFKDWQDLVINHLFIRSRGRQLYEN